MYFDMYRLKIGNKTIVLEDFKYSISEFSNKKRFWIRTPFGFNKLKESVDAYPILHNFLITKEYFDMDLEILVGDEYISFAKLNKCVMLNKKFAPDGIITYEFSGSFESITEENDKFLELSKEIIFD